VSDNLKLEAQRSHWTITKGYSRGYEYGLGFEIMEISKRRLVGHAGTALGFRSATFFDPREEIAVSVSANCKDAPALAMVRGIFAAIYHFADSAVGPTPKYRDKFNAQLYNSMANVFVVATRDAIRVLDPNSWEPFDWSETVVPLGRNKLRVVTSNSVHSEGENITYSFSNEKIKRVNFAGLTMYPEQVPESENESLVKPYTSGQTLPYDASEALFLRYHRNSDKEFFKLEVMPEYDLDDIVSHESLRAWLAGNVRHSIELMERLKSEDAERPPWIQAWPKGLKVGQTAVRIRLVDDDFTPYMLWEREHFLRVNLPLCGERVYYVQRRFLEAADLILPACDTVIFNNRRVMVNGRSGSKLKFTHRTFYDSSDAELLRFLTLKKCILRLIAHMHLDPLS